MDDETAHKATRSLRIIAALVSVAVIVVATVAIYRQIRPIPYDHVEFFPTAVTNTVPGVTGPAIVVGDPIILSLNLDDNSPGPVTVRLTATVSLLAEPTQMFPLIPETPVTVYQQPGRGTVAIGNGRLDFPVPAGITHSTLPVPLPEALLAMAKIRLSAGLPVNVLISGTLAALHPHAVTHDWSTETFRIVA